MVDFIFSTWKLETVGSIIIIIIVILSCDTV